MFNFCVCVSYFSCGNFVIISGTLFLVLAVLPFHLASLRTVRGILVLHSVKFSPGGPGSLGDNPKGLHVVTDIAFPVKEFLRRPLSENGVKKPVHDTALDPEGISGTLSLVLGLLINVLRHPLVFTLVNFKLIRIQEIKIQFNVKNLHMILLSLKPTLKRSRLCYGSMSDVSPAG